MSMSQLLVWLVPTWGATWCIVCVLIPVVQNRREVRLARAREFEREHRMFLLMQEVRNIEPKYDDEGRMESMTDEIVRVARAAGMSWPQIANTWGIAAPEVNREINITEAIQPTPEYGTPEKVEREGQWFSVTEGNMHWDEFVPAPRPQDERELPVAMPVDPMSLKLRFAYGVGNFIRGEK